MNKEDMIKQLLQTWTSGRNHKVIDLEKAIKYLTIEKVHICAKLLIIGCITTRR